MCLVLQPPLPSSPGCSPQEDRPDKDELVAKKILVQQPDGSLIEETAIPLDANVVSRTIEWLQRQPGMALPPQPPPNPHF
jgi:hypothetical protein